MYLSECTSIQDKQEVTQELKAYTIQGWLHKKEDVAQDIQKYLPIRHELAMIDSMCPGGPCMHLHLHMDMNHNHRL